MINCSPQSCLVNIVMTVDLVESLLPTVQRLSLLFMIQIQRYLVYFSLINRRLFFDLFKENILDFLVGYQFVNDCVELFLWRFTSARCSNRIYRFKLPVLIYSLSKYFLSVINYYTKCGKRMLAPLSSRFHQACF